MDLLAVYSDGQCPSDHQTGLDWTRSVRFKAFIIYTAGDWPFWLLSTANDYLYAVGEQFTYACR